MFLNMNIYMIMYMFSIFMISYFYNQILMTLLSMEFLMLSVLLMLSHIFMINNIMLLLLYYLIFVVCESVMGLTLLINLIRSNGNDNLMNLNLILW